MGNIVGIAIVWLIIEMLVWYLIAQFVSGWWVFLWFVVAGFVGAALIKKGIATLKPMAGQAQAAMLNPAMRPNENSVVKAIAFAVAGILLVLPGILSDIAALIVLLPAVQNKFKAFAKDYATKNPEKLMALVAKITMAVNLARPLTDKPKRSTRTPNASPALPMMTRQWIKN